MASVQQNIYGTANPAGTPSLSNPTPTSSGNSFDWSAYFDKLYQPPTPQPALAEWQVPGTSAPPPPVTTAPTPAATPAPTYNSVPGYNSNQMASTSTAQQLAGQYGAGVVQTNPIGPVAPPPQTALNFGGGTDPLNAGLLSYTKENNTYGTLYDDFIKAQLAQSASNPTYKSGNPTQSMGAGLAPVFSAIPGVSPTPTTGTNTTPILQAAANPTSAPYTTAPGAQLPSTPTATAPTPTTPTAPASNATSPDWLKLFQALLSGQTQTPNNNSNSQMLDLLLALGGLGGNNGPRTLNLSAFRTPSQSSERYQVGRTPSGYTRWNSAF